MPHPCLLVCVPCPHPPPTCFSGSHPLSDLSLVTPTCLSTPGPTPHWACGLSSHNHQDPSSLVSRRRPRFGLWWRFNASPASRGHDSYPGADGSQEVFTGAGGLVSFSLCYVGLTASSWAPPRPRYPPLCLGCALRSSYTQCWHFFPLGPCAPPHPHTYDVSSLASSSHSLAKGAI